MSEFRELKEWEKAHNLTVTVYEITQNFPEEFLGLAQQIRGVCAAIAVKIAQGCDREDISEQESFLKVARDFAIELEYHLLLCYDLHIIETADYDRLVSGAVEVKGLVESFIKKLRKTDS